MDFCNNINIENIVHNVVIRITCIYLTLINVFKNTVILGGKNISLSLHILNEPGQTRM